MISAEKAREVTQATKIGITIQAIEKAIEKAMDEGKYETRVSISIMKDGVLANKYRKIYDELIDLGYRVTMQWAEPKPANCPMDEWDYCNGYIWISWAEEEV